jgi:hypothetical protein
MGIAKIKESKVMYTELKINGRKPNSPFEGAHTDEPSRLKID